MNFINEQHFFWNQILKINFDFHYMHLLEGEDMCKIALFGEAERGELSYPYCIKSIENLFDILGHPPDESFGIFFAVQSLLNNCDLIFFRVSEEGFSIGEYLVGFSYLKNKAHLSSLHGIAIPGVGDHKLIDETKKICTIYNSLLLVTEKDLYDYLTTNK